MACSFLGFAAAVVLPVTMATTLSACSGDELGGAMDAGPAAANEDSAAALDAAEKDNDGSAPVVACTSANDCLGAGTRLSSVVCCTNKTCAYDAPDDCTNANMQNVHASDYDQSCTTDHDCVSIGEGNGCYAGAFDCPNAAINKNAYAQYQSDIAKTHAGSCFAASGCPAEFGPCCQAGRCTTGVSCSSPTPVADAGMQDAADQDASGDPCGGPCSAGTRCVQLGTVLVASGSRFVCAGPVCGASSLDGGACPNGETCKSVTYDPCPPPPPGQAQCNIASVTYDACVAAATDAGGQ